MSTGRSGSPVRRSRLLYLVGLLMLGLATPPSLPAQAALEEQVRSIAAQLRCPVCQNLSVADSSSELARNMREVIREQLQAGKTPEEVRTYFVSKYGEWILLSPRPRGLSFLLWIGPFAGAAAGLAVTIRVVRRWARGRMPRAGPAADPALLQRVRREALRDDADAILAEPESLSPPELERNRLYAALRELAFDYRSGKLSPADYEGMREEYEARAVVVLGERDRVETALPPISRAPDARRAAASLQPEPRLSPRRPWRLVVGGILLLAFGFSLGYALTQSLRPRLGERDTVTGDVLTGTGPGGMGRGRLPARDVKTLIAAGRSAYDREDWQGAISAVKEALALDPENPEAHSTMGLILLHAGRGEEALRAIDRALARDPSHPSALWAKGVALFEAKRDYAGAIQSWEALMVRNLSPEDADRVARMITEARSRLAPQPSESRR